jgi:hypothetical protein
MTRLAREAIAGKKENADAGAKPGFLGDGHRAVAIHPADDIAGKRQVGA